jgi:hypothetical protein
MRRNRLSSILLLAVLVAVIQRSEAESRRPRPSTEDAGFSDRRSAFLPGLGAFGTDSVRKERSQGATAADDQSLDGDSPSAHAKTTSGFSFSEGASPPTYDHDHAKGGKCTFVQMKGGPLPTGDCHKGGMACDKHCGYGAPEPDCQVHKREPNSFRRQFPLV